MNASPPMNDQQDKMRAHDAIRAAGGIVHSDGNIFFTNAEKFLAAATSTQQARIEELEGVLAELMQEAEYQINYGLPTPERLEESVERARAALSSLPSSGGVMTKPNLGCAFNCEWPTKCCTLGTLPEAAGVLPSSGEKEGQHG